MKKVFGFIAMALTIVACNKIDVTVLEPAEEDNSITITAQLAPKTPISKAVSDAGNGTISVSWAENEHIAVLYEVSSEKKVADATITAVNAAGVATISFSVAGGTAENTPCILVYPLSAAKADHSGVKEYADLLAVQDGSLNANLDVRVGAGTIQIATPGLTVATQPAPQFALFKFTLTKDGSTAINAKGFAVKNGSTNAVITSVYPVYPSTTLSAAYVALPSTTSGTSYKFVANDGKKKYTTQSISSTANIESGVFYQTALNMGAGVTTSEVMMAELDFTSQSNWPTIPTDAYTFGTESYTDSNSKYTITLYGPETKGYKLNDGYLIFGQSDAYLMLPEFGWPTTKITVIGRSGASQKVTQNIYVGSTAVSTQTTGATGTYNYSIGAAYIDPGNVYSLKVTNKNNTQVTYLRVYSIDIN